MEELRSLMLLVEGLCLTLATGDLARIPKPGILFDAGSHFFIRLQVQDGPDFVLNYQVLYHSFGRPLHKPSFEKSVRVEDPKERWEIGILEDASDDPDLVRAFSRSGEAGPDLFRAFVRHGYTDRAVLFRQHPWDDAYIAAHRGEELWDSYSEVVSLLAFPLRSEETARPALEFLTAELSRRGIRTESAGGKRRLAVPAGTIRVEGSD
jgi:hypothetical protein